MHYIKFVWDIIELASSAQELPPTTTTELWKEKETAWLLQIPPADSKSLVASLPRRVTVLSHTQEIQHVITKVSHDFLNLLHIDRYIDTY